MTTIEKAEEWLKSYLLSRLKLKDVDYSELIKAITFDVGDAVEYMADFADFFCKEEFQKHLLLYNQLEHDYENTVERLKKEKLALENHYKIAGELSDAEIGILAHENRRLKKLEVYSKERERELLIEFKKHSLEDIYSTDNKEYKKSIDNMIKVSVDQFLKEQ